MASKSYRNHHSLVTLKNKFSWLHDLQIAVCKGSWEKTSRPVVYILLSDKVRRTYRDITMGNLRKR